MRKQIQYDPAEKSHKAIEIDDDGNRTIRPATPAERLSYQMAIQGRGVRQYGNPDPEGTWLERWRNRNKYED